MSTNNNPKIIAIFGGSGSGKSWLASQLQNDFGTGAVRVSLDDFYHDLGHLPARQRAQVNFDRPQTIDWTAFEAVLRNCRAGNVTDMPEYDFTTHTRLLKKKLLIPAPLILVDGLWLLWPPAIAELFDLKIFLDCPLELRLKRRLARDLAERGRTPASIRAQFFKTVAPMHELFVAPQAKRADLILKQPFGEEELDGLIEVIGREVLPERAGETIETTHREPCLQTN